MKKNIFLFAFLIISIISCNRTSYFYVSDVRIAARSIYDTLNIITGLPTATDSAYQYPLPIAFDSVFWQVGTEVSYAKNAYSNPFFQTAMAKDVEPIFNPLYDLEYIYILAETNYNDYEVGDTINNLFKVKTLDSNYISIQEFLLDEINKSSRYYGYASLQLYLKEQPRDTLDFSFKVIYKFEKEIYHHKTSSSVKLF